MQLIFLFLVALALLSVAAYAQLRIPRFTLGAGRIFLSRAFLFLVGLGFGWTFARGTAGEWERGLMFLAGFGLVHVPAAVILFIKGKRGSGRS